MATVDFITSAHTHSLICPVCQSPLCRREGSLVCDARHTYDIARAGYVNLVNTSSHRASGDSRECVQARTEFLSSEAYAPFREAICEAAGEGGVLVDAGCGEGYYTCTLARRFAMTYGFDLSKASITAAARRAAALGVRESTFFGVGSVYALPIASGAADTVVNVFAPCVEEEYSRILRPGGVLVVACAGEDHLKGLKSVLYDELRPNTERADLPCSLEHISCRRVRYDITLDTPELIRALYLMTPYAYRTSVAAEQRLFSLDSLTTTVDFDIHVYKK